MNKRYSKMELPSEDILAFFMGDDDIHVSIYQYLTVMEFGFTSEMSKKVLYRIIVLNRGNIKTFLDKTEDDFKDMNIGYNMDIKDSDLLILENCQKTIREKLAYLLPQG